MNLIGSMMVFVSLAVAQEQSFELNTALMRVTFQIAGPLVNRPDRTTFGTVFIIGRPTKADPKISYNVLVTAAHVLDDIGTDTATLTLREPDGKGLYTPFVRTIQIREKGKALYTKHESADVAAMYLPLPQKLGIELLPMAFLVDDKTMTDIELHPGDQVLCLGFPLMASGPGGFPILRSGRLASYPLTPAKTVKALYYDVLLYGGNSGGPAYYSFENRVFAGATHIGIQQGILGLVVQQANSKIPEFADKPLNLGVIVPAVYIRETIDKLPSLDK